MNNPYFKFIQYKSLIRLDYFFKDKNIEEVGMSRNSCLIEVQVPSGSKGWQKVVDHDLRQALDTLKDSVEALGGKVYIRY